MGFISFWTLRAVRKIIPTSSSLHAHLDRCALFGVFDASEGEHVSRRLKWRHVFGITPLPDAINRFDSSSADLSETSQTSLISDRAKIRRIAAAVQ